MTTTAPQPDVLGLVLTLDNNPDCEGVQLESATPAYLLLLPIVSFDVVTVDGEVLLEVLFVNTFTRDDRWAFYKDLDPVFDDVAAIEAVCMEHGVPVYIPVA